MGKEWINKQETSLQTDIKKEQKISSQKTTVSHAIQLQVSMKK
jgi:hypothetical protein